MEHELNLEDMDAKDIDRMEQTIAEYKQRFKWNGTGGLWSTFRDIGKEYARKPFRDVSKLEKMERLLNEIDDFREDRLVPAIERHKEAEEGDEQ